MSFPIRPEKLTEALTVKMPDTMLRELRAVAESNGEEAPEFVRRLISDALDGERARYAVLHSIFGRDCPESKEISDDQGNQG